MWLGIDFGTTNTSAAVKRGPTEDAELIALRAGAREPYDLVLGSIVYEAPGGKTFTGRDALFRQALDDEKEGRSGIIHREFKRWFASPRLACEYDELVPHYGPADHNDVPSYYEEKVRRRVPQDGATADDPHTGRAELLRAQRLLATQALDIALSKAKIRPSDIEKLILGVPLTFGEFSQRRYLEALGGLTIKGKPLFKGWRDALSRVTFLYEPLAAAIAHRELRGDAPETVLVFDMGGGTLDLAAIAMQPNARGILQPVRELGYDGLPVAGGALDRALVAHLRREHRKFGQAYEREQGVRRHLLEELAQEIKIGLSTATAYEANDPSVGRFTVRREDFESAIASQLAEIRAAVASFLGRIRLQATSVSRVLMTGGSSAVPVVQREVERLFPGAAARPSGIVRPDPADRKSLERSITCVARGLAEYAGAASFERTTGADVKVFSPFGGKDDREQIQIAIDRMRPRPAPGAPFPGPEDVRLGVSRSPGYAGASVAVLASLVRDDPLLLVTDVALPAVPEECELVIRLERDAVWPRFAIVRRGTEDVLAEFSLDRVSESALGAFLREETRGISARDVDGMQAERSPHPLLEQLRIGDCVRLRSRALHGAVPSDQVLRIRECREIRTGETRTQRGQAIPGFVLSSYMMRFETVARDGTAASSVDLQACYQNVDGEIVTS